ncbi:syntaxin-binding protein 5 isoform X4 [Drosophila kikkawai]|uniref:Syntaxin-binding protein 5 isoform X4 n=1 Tax=Drosophila kikkawai TaxID=30033 RepID=A0A6P4J8D2_DROKI|nr:syntaxin-binding protein 5 isoform X1 [Drosophila kikkawai]XP_041631086.1 syntaxin-binding protein 5 isoform X1 [Drosophila kikkawai]XP_041631087.1 syntaxin-binding protein 5 isoform X1 [Drosophila kikkawai]XP_041631088.1 syntaxin-binding protein 5 isoform X1 [Drosophila kikkawai]
MKKFTFKGVLDGFRQSVQPQATRQEQEIQEQLKADHFTLKKTFRHGFPYSPTSFAFDPVQKILAIGDKSGYIRILGRPGVDAHAKHEGESECAVLFTQFLVNEGALVTVTADDTIHLWNIRQKTPRIVQSLKFQRERVTCIHLPVGSKWLYVGTEKGNIHVVHIDTFALSGYIINWNKAIEVVRTSHPGAVIALCDNPLDANKLLIAFECGLLVLWDLKAKCAEIRWQAAEAVKSLAWHYEGKYFVSSHTDGSICSWPTKPQAKPQSQVCPHAKPNKDGNAEKCKPIYKVDLKSSTTGETFTIFSGGMPSEKGSKSNCITVMVGKATTVLEMEHAVCDFITLCENPWPCETQEPYAIAVLLQYDLVLIDLLTPGFPCFESPYPMDLHESPVTCCTYLTDCPSDLVPAFYSVGRTTTSKKSCFSEREWPISGGEWSPASCSYSEIVITGHQDGSLKFWDSGAGTLQILYKLKTAKMFEKPRSHVAHSHPESDNPLAVHLIFLCSESRRLCVAGAMGQVMLFKFRKMESTSEVLVLEIPILYENFDDIYGTSPECDFLTGHQVQKTESSDSDKTTECSLKVRFGAQRKPPGFQSQLVCLTTGPNRRNVQVTSLCISSSYGLMAYGTEYGLVIIDIIQKICLLSVACPDLYGAHDPYSRTPKSPKRIENKEEQSRSPSSDQINGSGVAAAQQQQSQAQQQQQQLQSQQTQAQQQFTQQQQSQQQQQQLQQQQALLQQQSQSQQQMDEAGGSGSGAGAAASSSGSSVYGADDADKLDGTFSRSRSSSMSSIDMSSSESVTCLAFIESYAKRNDILTLVPTLWIGTSFGSILTLFITMPDRDVRKSQPVLITINGGPVVRLKGSITSMSFLDSYGSIIPYTFETWRDENKDKKDRTPTKSSSRTSPTFTPTTANTISNTSIAGGGGGGGASAGGAGGAAGGSSGAGGGSSSAGAGAGAAAAAAGGGGGGASGSGGGAAASGSAGASGGGGGGGMSSSSASSSGISGSVSTGLETLTDRQYIVIASEKQTKVFDVANQCCINRIQLSEMDFAVKAETITMKDGSCLATYLSNGHLMVHSLPSLKLLLDTDFLPLMDLSFQTKCKQGIVDPMLSIWGQQIIVHEDTTQISKIFCFSHKGHGLYMASPTEIQKFTISSEFCQFILEMMGELYTVQEMPEQPKEGFFKGLFGGGAKLLDREELFGEQSGKANRSVARHIPGPNLEQLGQRASTAASEISRAHQLAMERGEKLNLLEERAERMANTAQDFSGTAHQLMLKYKDKKWYQL